MAELKKIYRIEVPGIESATEKVRKLNEELALQKAIKQEAQKVLVSSKGDADAIERQTKIIAQSEIAIKKLSAEKRIASKEADLLIRAAEKEAVAQVETANAALFAAGSVNQAAAQYKALLALTQNAGTGTLINWQGETIGIEDAKKKLREYKGVVDDFNRSLSPDGTLVGEYKRGIINAFRELGLTDIIKGQKAKIEAEIKDLQIRNQQLAKQMADTGKVGTEAFQKIEKELVDNIELQKKMEGQLGEINSALKNTNTLGSQISNSINSGFKNLVTTGLAAVGIGLGLNEVFKFMGESIDEFEQAEQAVSRLESTLSNLGRGDVMDRIKEKAKEVKEQFGFLDDDDVIEFFNQFITYGKLTENEINTLLPVVIDFASKQRISIKEASEAVIAALEGNSKSLKQYGINVKDAKTETERLNIIMTELKPRVEGAAEAFKNIETGKIAIAKQEVADLKEEIGEGLLPLKAKILGFFSDLIKGAQNFASDLELGFGNIFRGGELRRQVQGLTKVIDEEFKKSSAGLQDLPVDELTTKLIESQHNLELVRNSLNRINAGKNDLGLTEDQLKARSENLTIELGVTEKLIAKVKELIKVREGGDQILGIGDRDKLDPAELEKRKREAERLAKELLQRQLRDIDTEALLRKLELEKQRRANLVDEEKYQKTLFIIETTAIDKKIELIKGAGSEERNQRAQLQLELVQKEKDSADKIFAIRKDNLEKQLASAKDNAELQASLFTQTAGASPAQKISDKINLDVQLLQLQKEFNEKMKALEVEFGKASQDNEIKRAKALAELRATLNKEAIDLARANFEEEIEVINATYVSRITEIAVRLRNSIQNILNNPKLSSAKKIEEIGKAQSKAELEALNREIEGDQKRLEVYKDMLRQKLITQVEYDKAVKELLDKQIKREELIAQQSIEIELKKKKIKDQLLTGAFDIVNSFLQAEAERQEARLDKEKDIANERLDIEKEQQLAQAQSSAERDSIEKEFEAKHKEQDKIAGERMKQQKLKELEILTAVAVLQALASSPPPFSFIQAGIILIKALIEKGRINAQTFAGGGKVVNPVSLSSGRITASPNVSPTKSGDNVLALVKPGEVILNKSQQQRLGGSSTFRRIGVPGFADGGLVPLGSDKIGDQLQVPSDANALLSSFSLNASFDKLEQMIGLVTVSVQTLAIQTNKRIDQIQVVQDPRSVQDAQKKLVNNEALSTI